MASDSWHSIRGIGAQHDQYICTKHEDSTITHSSACRDEAPGSKRASQKSAGLRKVCFGSAVVQKGFSLQYPCMPSWPEHLTFVITCNLTDCLIPLLSTQYNAVPSCAHAYAKLHFCEIDFRKALEGISSIVTHIIISIAQLAGTAGKL